MAKIKSDDVTMAWLGLDSMNGRLMAGDPGKMRDLQGMVPPRTTIVVLGRPQRPWRGRRLYVHQPIASSFMIHSVRAGLYETTAGVGGVPADAFATRMDRLATIQDIFDREGVVTIAINATGAAMLGAEWSLPLVHPGTDIVFVIENITDEPARFLAGFLGELAEWP